MLRPQAAGGVLVVYIRNGQLILRTRQYVMYYLPCYREVYGHQMGNRFTPVCTSLKVPAGCRPYAAIPHRSGQDTVRLFAGCRP